MLFIILAVLLIIVGFCIYKVYEYKWCTSLDFLRDLLIAIGITILFICLIELATKPVIYRQFRVRYEVITKMNTSKDDVRDATYTKELIELNKKITKCRLYQNSYWVGIFQNKKICEYELLNKEE